jgi:hypothetical protein
MLSMFDLTRLAFCRSGDNGLFTEEAAISFLVAPVNPGFASWNDPRKERLIVYNFITVSRTHTPYMLTIREQSSHELRSDPPRVL